MNQVAHNLVFIFGTTSAVTASHRGNKGLQQRSTSPTSSRRSAAPLKTVNTLTAMSACLRRSSTGSGLTGARLQPGRMPNARLLSATARTKQRNQRMLGQIRFSLSIPFRAHHHRFPRRYLLPGTRYLAGFCPSC